MTTQDAHDPASRQPRATAVQTTESRSQRWIVLGLAVWLVAVVAISASVWRYKLTPGPVGHTPAHWPAATALSRERIRPQLVMFLHPRCACSRASLAELSQLRRAMQGKVAVTVVFGLPVGAPPSWSSGELWETARAIPGARVVADPDCRESVRFGALTSGFATLYDTSGALMFAGGMTPGRGHQGDNPGLQRVCSSLAGTGTVRPTSPVFGCVLVPSSSERRSSGAD